MSNRKARPSFEYNPPPKMLIKDCTPDQAWRAGRLAASLGGGPYKAAIDALTPIETSSVPTMGVDKFFRVYYNPDFIMSLIVDAEAVSEENPCKMCGATSHIRYAYIAGIIWHEAQHPLRKHMERFAEKGFSNRNKWSAATDCEINDEAVELFAAIFEENKKERTPSPLICVHPEGTYPQNWDLPLYLSAEEYYMLLPEQPYGNNCGSADNGSTPEWEVGPPSEQFPGVDEQDVETIEKMVAKDIQSAAGRGIGGLGAMKSWANKVLPTPQYDWEKELQSMVSFLCNRIFGTSRRDFRRFHRKSAATNFQTVMPATFSSTPKIVIVEDTSGSMGGRREAHALAEAREIIKSVGADVFYACAEYDAGVLQSVQSLDEVDRTGGGGTSMRRGMRTTIQNVLDLGVTPDLAILITDLETDYPLEEEMQGIELLIVGINEQQTSTWGEKIPDWAKFVHIPIKH